MSRTVFSFNHHSALDILMIIIMGLQQPLMTKVLLFTLTGANQVSVIRVIRAGARTGPIIAATAQLTWFSSP